MSLNDQVTETEVLGQHAKMLFLQDQAKSTQFINAACEDPFGQPPSQLLLAALMLYAKAGVAPTAIFSDAVMTIHYQEHLRAYPDA